MHVSYSLNLFDVYGSPITMQVVDARTRKGIIQLKSACGRWFNWNVLLGHPNMKGH